MKLQSLLKLIKSNEQLNIYDVINNVYLHQNILKEDCDDVYNSYKVIEVETNSITCNYPVIEIGVASSKDLFIG
jgi:hypothetical protein